MSVSYSLTSFPRERPFRAPVSFLRLIIYEYCSIIGSFFLSTSGFFLHIHSWYTLLMNKKLIGLFIVLFMFVSTAVSVQAASLTNTQIQAILDLLSSFGADSATI